MRDETKCLHSGYKPGNAEPRVLPIVQSITYAYDTAEEIAKVFDDRRCRWCTPASATPR